MEDRAFTGNLSGYAAVCYVTEDGDMGPQVFMPEDLSDIPGVVRAMMDVVRAAHGHNFEKYKASPEEELFWSALRALLAKRRADAEKEQSA